MNRTKKKSPKFVQNLILSEKKEERRRKFLELYILRFCQYVSECNINQFVPMYLISYRISNKHFVFSFLKVEYSRIITYTLCILLLLIKKDLQTLYYDVFHLES
ncbi:hypothetical protein WA026_020968 [Henosepilachna vigintioctopunctata]|uniref:Uncharacterized protein n=1 Tax=Henosepilachna vigintioctopunctata TaxID=420089 RepID=A0AAW1VA55_9CUCU